jgi:hypothetical protein
MQPCRSPYLATIGLRHKSAIAEREIGERNDQSEVDPWSVSPVSVGYSMQRHSARKKD